MELDLIDFMTFNSIPNIVEGVNNVLYYGTDGQIKLPTWSYKIADVETYVNDYLIKNNDNTQITITANKNTLKSEMFSNVQLEFKQPNSLRSILGFAECILEPKILHSSILPISIDQLETVRLVCKLVSCSFNNGVDHIIHEFYPTVLPGHKIVEIPTNVIYLPLNTTEIHNITVRLEDEKGRKIISVTK